jgi:hypothetical protein
MMSRNKCSLISRPQGVDMVSNKKLSLILLAGTLLLSACGDGSDQSTDEGAAGGIEGGTEGGITGATTADGTAGGEATLDVTVEAGPSDGAAGVETTAEAGIDLEALEVDARGGGAAAIDAAWEQIGGLEAGAPFKLTLSEADMEAKIAAEMEAQGFGANMTDFDVTLDNQQIGVSFNFTAEGAPVSVPASILFNASIDANGDLQLEATEAQAGPVALPPEALTGLSEALAQVMVGARSNGEADVTLTNLVIAGGEMTIEGTVKPE